MNVIVIMLDSLRQDFVNAYNKTDCPLKTPNLDKFANEAVLFNNCYPEGLPTIPVRTDLMTGMSTLTNRPWQPLVPTDVTASQILRKEGYLTALIADTYHIFKPDMNFHKNFDIFQWIRGAEYDGVHVGPLKSLKFEDFVNENIPTEWHGYTMAALRNLDGKTEPEEFPCWKTMNSALSFLEEARQEKRPKFLWIDTFQTHEPWYPPVKFDTFGDPDYKGPKIILPPGGPAAKWGDEEVQKRTCSLYTGEVAYTDFCVGKLFDGMRRLGYFDDSVIVVLSDHGHPLGDHGKFLKGSDRLYSELLKVPFMIRFPKSNYCGKHLNNLSRFSDMLPTLLDIVGLKSNTK
ncbi:MAG: sulfatase, partial [Planctomycetota bacterium]